MDWAFELMDGPLGLMDSCWMLDVEASAILNCKFLMLNELQTEHLAFNI